MPRLITMSLPEDHATGTTPGTFTPQACVASSDLALGRRAAVQLLVDGADANTATTLMGYAAAIVAESNVDLQAEAAGVRLTPPLSYEPRVFYNPELRSTQFLVPGLIGFILMLTAVLSTALAVVREKERGGGPGGCPGRRGPGRRWSTHHGNRSSRGR